MARPYPCGLSYIYSAQAVFRKINETGFTLWCAESSANSRSRKRRTIRVAASLNRL